VSAKYKIYPLPLHLGKSILAKESLASESWIPLRFIQATLAAHLPGYAGCPAQTGGGRNRVEEKLSFRYDREADILYINRCPPYPEQESEELGDDVIARLNPATGAVENLEVLFFSTRLLRSDLLELPVTAELHLTVTGPSSR
jgi:Protein of unknown function (DUF2283)